MNSEKNVHEKSEFRFRPQQGLPIMNWTKRRLKKVTIYASFRPQQGLPIMNSFYKKHLQCMTYWFPSPTGVTYYEFSHDVP